MCKFTFSVALTFCAQHRDSGAYKYSAILYLTPDSPPQLGTSTWKHQATGLHGDPTKSDVARNNKTAEALLNLLEADPGQDEYEEIDRIGNRFNRLLVRWSFFTCSCVRNIPILALFSLTYPSTTEFVQIFNSKLNHRSSQLGGLGSNIDNGRLILILFFNTQDRLGQENSILYHDDDGNDDSSSRTTLSGSTSAEL